MKSSFRIAKVFGIPVELHWTFLLLFVWVYFAGGGELSHWREILIWLITVIALFACVVLHEFGHALMARRYGVKTKDIILSPIGGVARLEGLPEKPIQEFWVALAGPLVNVAIILALLPIQYFFPNTLTHFLGLFNEESNTFLWEMFRLEYMIPFLIAINLMLVLFNLIPAFPMDGGRILRALLAMRFSRLKATQWAARIGQVFAIGLFVWGLYESHLVLSFIGLFVFFAAATEYRYVKNDHLLSTYTLGDLFLDPTFSLREEDSIDNAISAAEKGYGPYIPVKSEAGAYVGVLATQDIEPFISNAPLYPVHVSDYLKKTSNALSSELSLKDAYFLLSREQPVFPVFSGSLFRGLIFLEKLHAFVKQKEQEGRMNWFRSKA